MNTVANILIKRIKALVDRKVKIASELADINNEVNELMGVMNDAMDLMEQSNELIKTVLDAKPIIDKMEDK